jgi:hypothetical protein
MPTLTIRRCVTSLCLVSQAQLLCLFLLMFLIPDVLPDRRFISPNRTHAVALGPEMHPRKITGPAKILPVNPNRRLAFQSFHSIRHAIRGRNAQTHMYMIGHCMPLNQLDPQLLAKVPQGLPDILAERAKDCFLPIFRYYSDVVPAIPPDVALTLPLSHCGFSSSWPWRVQEGRNHSSPHESTPERQSLFESHRQWRWLTRWSYATDVEVEIRVRAQAFRESGRSKNRRRWRP